MGLNAEDLKSLANEFSGLARALADWGNAHPIADPPQQTQLDNLVTDLVGASDKLMNAAVTAALAAVAVSVADLQSATQKAKHALSHIKDVTKVLAIAGAAIGVGASLLSPTPATVSGALNGLIQAVPQATAPSAGP